MVHEPPDDNLPLEGNQCRHDRLAQRIPRLLAAEYGHHEVEDIFGGKLVEGVVAIFAALRTGLFGPGGFGQVIDRFEHQRSPGFSQVEMDVRDQLLQQVTEALVNGLLLQLPQDLLHVPFVFRKLLLFLAFLAFFFLLLIADKLFLLFVELFLQLHELGRFDHVDPDGRDACLHQQVMDAAHFLDLGRLKGQAAGERLQVVDIEVGQKHQMVDAAGKEERGEFRQDRVFMADRLVADVEPVLADRAEEFIVIDNQVENAAGRFVQGLLEGGVGRRVILDRLDQLGQVLEGGFQPGVDLLLVAQKPLRLSLKSP